MTGCQPCLATGRKCPGERQTRTNLPPHLVQGSDATHTIFERIEEVVSPGEGQLLQRHSAQATEIVGTDLPVVSGRTNNGQMSSRLRARQQPLP
jgi:hypothetical protein